MNWYAAHLIMYVKFKVQPQPRFPVWENIVLISANSEEEAFAKAERRGKEDEGDDDGTFRWGENPAEWVFAGVRKLTACQDEEQRPGDGTEVTCIEMELDSRKLVEDLVAGEPIVARVADRFPIATAE